MDEHHQLQQLTLELSRKRMIFSKKSLQLSKVVGQGTNMNFAFNCTVICLLFHRRVRIGVLWIPGQWSWQRYGRCENVQRYICHTCISHSYGGSMYLI